MDRNDVQLNSAANCLLFFKPFAAPAETGVSALPRKQSVVGEKKIDSQQKQREKCSAPGGSSAGGKNKER
jgi:hypothetical protein